MRLKIISDGTGNGTVVVDAETGEPIEDVTDVTWTIGVKEKVATATIKLWMTPVELIADQIIKDTGETTVPVYKPADLIV